MNRKTHTITAYKLDFKRYRCRNTISINEMENKFSNLIEDFVSCLSNKTSMGKNSQRAMKVNGYKKHEISTDCILHNLIVKSGKFGEKIELVNMENDDAIIYDENYVGLYGHNVFCYEYQNEVIFIFHRISNSGCKTVFVELFNEYLKANGYYALFTACYCPKNIEIDQSSILPKKNNFNYIFGS